MAESSAVEGAPSAVYGTKLASGKSAQVVSELSESLQSLDVGVAVVAVLPSAT